MLQLSCPFTVCSAYAHSTIKPGMPHKHTDSMLAIKPNMGCPQVQVQLTTAHSPEKHQQLPSCKPQSPFRAVCGPPVQA